MKKISRIALLLAVVAGYSFQSQASLLIEPVVGYNIGSKVDFESGKNYTGGTGSAFGGRLGYQNLGFQLGIDYLRSSIDMDHKDIDKNVTINEWAGFVGFEFPVLVRVYAGYIFSATGTTEAQGAEVDMSEGSGTKMGVGFTGLPFIDINVEYRTGAFDKWKSAGVEQSDTIKYQSIMLGLSLPFTI